MDNTIEKLTDVIDNLIELNEENYSDGNGVYFNFLGMRVAFDILKTDYDF